MLCATFIVKIFLLRLWSLLLETECTVAQWDVQREKAGLGTEL
jgi:hypothetical protein